ncbi:MAG: hypothetical protein QOE88_1288, partial [Verrucomicrobiota bacterium]|nr:hypothetical protein [Verrucomicrobiota bacterium]
PVHLFRSRENGWYPGFRRRGDNFANSRPMDGLQRGFPYHGYRYPGPVNDLQPFREPGFLLLYQFSDERKVVLLLH